MHKIAFEDAGDWLSFSFPLGEREIPVRISREAMEAHFDAKAHASLADAYRTHAEQIHQRVAPLVAPGSEYTAQRPLLVKGADLH